MATGKFVLDKGRTGKFRFNLFSTNGRIVATSEAYETKAAALNGIAAIQKLAGDARVVDNTVAAANGATPAKTSKKAAAKKVAKQVSKRSAAPAPAGTSV